MGRQQRAKALAAAEQRLAEEIRIKEDPDGPPLSARKPSKDKDKGRKREVEVVELSSDDEKGDEDSPDEEEEAGEFFLRLLLRRAERGGRGS